MTGEPCRAIEKVAVDIKSSESSLLLTTLLAKQRWYDFFVSSGGISIKPSAGMSLMKGDMGGAATVTAALETIAKLELPLNVIAVTPLCENMPSGSANKPGDVVTAMNGKSVEVL